jgi:hypothetical protein
MTHTYLTPLRTRGIGVSLRPSRRPSRLVLGLIVVMGATVGAQDQSLGVSSARDLLASEPRAFAQALETARPLPVSAEAKAQILASLPEEGEVTHLGSEARSKVAGLNKVLRAAERDAVYEIKVISVPQAAVALHARAIVLISEAALNLLTAPELQAAVAHETGHEYVWAQYEEARKSSDHQRVRELELMCDAIAIVILHRLDIEASTLTTAIEKIGRFNRQRLGIALNEADYPSLAQRREFARAVAAWEKGSEKPRKGGD